jgi:SCY1-like protein 1
LPVILKIGGDHLDDKEYETTIIGLVVRLFASPDRAMRLALLENLSQFITKLDKRVVNDKIFPPIVRFLN